MTTWVLRQINLCNSAIFLHFWREYEQTYNFSTNGKALDVKAKPGVRGSSHTGEVPEEDNVSTNQAEWTKLSLQH